jgi:hypothetical protein
VWLAASLAIAGAVMLVAPAGSWAGSSAVCEQYPDLPQCAAPDAGTGGEPAGSPAAGGGAGPTPDEPAGGSIPGAGDATGASGSAGNLPFTGYPLSPLVMLVLGLLAAGLLLRAAVALRDGLDGAASARR